jgi:HTH-type transcriptional repressor of NAD biosynthesis genes
MFQHGLVIGKFYPPHAGHHFLIRTAAANCKHVTVVCEHTRYQRISLKDRLDWLRAEHREETNVRFFGARSDLPMNLTDTPTWDAEVAIIRAAATAHRYTGPVDAVFSSEFYGDRLAEYFDATHVMVDQKRERVPMSATKFRGSPITYWHNLAPATRAGLTTRICVVGAESTGTTTVARRLTDHFRRRPGFDTTQCVPEYGREYSEKKLAEAGSMEAIRWTPEDFNHIATMQNQMEQLAARNGPPILICDTDGLATRVWGQRYLATYEAQHVIGAPWSREPLRPRKDVYLVTDHVGVPFEQDGLRDGENIRPRMTGWFLDILTYREESWVLLTGTLQERVRLAVDVASTLLDENLGALQ